MTGEDATAICDLPAADVCVLIVSYNSADHLPGLLKSLEPASDGLRLRVVIVDNGSSDDSVRIGRGSGALVLSGGGNIGYAGGINIGRRWAQGCEAILVTNPDLRFEPGAIRVLHDVALREDCVAVPRLQGDAGTLQLSMRREPSIGRQLGEALLGDHWPSRPGWLATIVRQESAYKARREVEWATGAALMIPPTCDMVVGAWDESYFMYSEEVDYARRWREAGGVIGFVPAAVAVHTEGGSGRSEQLTLLDFLNKVRYVAEYHRRAYAVAYTGAILLELLMRFDRPAYRRSVPAVTRAAGLVARGRPLPNGRQIILGPASATRSAAKASP